MEEERGWLIKAIANRKKTKKQREIEMLELEIKKAELEKKLREVKE